MDIDCSLFKGNLKEFMSNSNFLIDAYSKEKLTEYVLISVNRNNEDNIKFLKDFKIKNFVKNNSYTGFNKKSLNLSLYDLQILMNADFELKYHLGLSKLNKNYNEWFINGLNEYSEETKENLFYVLKQMIAKPLYDKSRKYNHCYYNKLLSDYLFLVVYNEMDNKEDVLNKLKNIDLKNNIYFVDLLDGVVDYSKIKIDTNNYGNKNHYFISEIFITQNFISLIKENGESSNKIYNMFKKLKIKFSDNVNFKLFGDLTILNNSYPLSNFSLLENDKLYSKYVSNEINYLDYNIKNYIKDGFYQSINEFALLSLTNVIKINENKKIKESVEYSNKLKTVFLKLLTYFNEKHSLNIDYDVINNYLNEKINILILNKHIYTNSDKATNSLINLKNELDLLFDIKINNQSKNKIKSVKI